MTRTKVVQAKRAAIYCRVSTDDQSCERQERDLRAFAERAGFEVISVFKEKASGMKTDRPERKKLCALAQARHIDAILVTELSRWGRSLPDVVNTCYELSSFGVSLLAPSGLQFDLSDSTGTGKLMLSIFAGLAEFERSLLVERIHSGLDNARARGVKLGRQPGAKIRPHPLTKQMLAMHAAKVPVRKIASQLNISPTTVQKAITQSR